MTDKYEFHKSKQTQSVEDQTPYSQKNWGYINDINGLNYSNSGLTLVTFDMSSVYNSTNLVQPDSMYLAVPITIVNAFVTNAPGLVAPVDGSWASQGLKAGYFQLIHGCDFTLGGKVLNQYQSNTNAYVGFKTLSQMSADDLATLGPSLGLGTILDNSNSLGFNGKTNVVSAAGQPFGNALCIPSSGVGGNGSNNNKPFSMVATSTNGADQMTPGAQNLSTSNSGYQSRLKRVVDVTADKNKSNFYGVTADKNIVNNTSIRQEFRPVYGVYNNNYGVVHDVAIIRLADILDSFKNLPLMQRFDGQLRFYINTGYVASHIVTNTSEMLHSAQLNTFTNTCPLMQSCGIAALNPATAIGQVTGLFVGSPTNTSISFCGTNINLGASQAAHFMSACRIYYAQVQLKPRYLEPYLSANQAKTVVYTDFLSNTMNNISAGASASALIQSGVTNPRGVLIMPFISSSTHGVSTTAAAAIQTFSELQSPFSTAPIQTMPIGLLNLQVTIGGTNVLATPISYGYEHFLQQTVLYEKLAALDYGVSCGLISERYWDTFRCYYIDCSRADEANAGTTRNIVVSFTNNSLQTIDCLVFTEYFKSVTVDCALGTVNI